MILGLNLATETDEKFMLTDSDDSSLREEDDYYLFGIMIKFIIVYYLICSCN